jgi:hypothetical protein
MTRYSLGSYWRDKAAPIIAQVIKENKDKPEKELKAALFKAYPFGERKYHPYKIWCDEVAKQLGKKSRYFSRRKKKAHKLAVEAGELLDGKQMKLL